MPDFTFLVASDLHYVADACRTFFARVVDQMRAADPAFVVVLGDLGEEGTAGEFAAVRSLLDSVGVPVRVVCGNHDWTTDTSRAAFFKYFPGPTNYTFEHHLWQFVALDSTCGRAWENTAVPDESLRWLDDTLSTLDRAQPTVLLTHFPLGERVRYRVTNADEVLDRFAGHNLRHVFNGHFHGTTEIACNGFTITTGPCCSFARRNHDGTEDKGFVLVHASGDTLERAFVPIK